MAKYTNSGLVAYCRDAYTRHTKYMWGGIMRPITPSYISMLAGMYPAQYPSARKSVLKQAGSSCYGVDCVGLIKSYYWGGFGSPKYSGKTDYGVGSMYSAAKIKGKISSFPLIAGLLVMTADFGHVGVYVGGGKVIESTLGSRGDGVIMSELSSVGWAYWCQCPCIEADNLQATASKRLAYSANLRQKPDDASAKLRSIKAGSTVTVYAGTETADKSVSGGELIYIKVRYMGVTGWIVKSALE